MSSPRRLEPASLYYFILSDQQDSNKTPLNVPARYAHDFRIVTGTSHNPHPLFPPIAIVLQAQQLPRCHY